MRSTRSKVPSAAAWLTHAQILLFTSTLGLVTTTEDEPAAMDTRPAGSEVVSAPVVTAADALVDATAPTPCEANEFSVLVGTWTVCPAM